MDLTPKQQASEAIRQAETILVVTGQRPSIDQTTAVLSLTMILRKLNKKVTAVVSDSLPPSINWLVSGQLDRNLEGLRDFIVKVDLSRSEVDKLKYTIENGKLNIHVTPFKGGFSQSDVSFGYGAYHYDLIIALGVPSKSKLDRVFSSHPELLGSTPLINLDFHRINENYGAVNLIEPTASSLSEMLVALSESLQNGLIDEPIATALLAGIVASTDRFTATHTTPKAMTVAAQLMAAGGKQQQIVKALYRDSRHDQKDARPSQKPATVQPTKPLQPSAPVAAPVTARPAVSASSQPVNSPASSTASTPVAPQVTPDPMLRGESTVSSAVAPVTPTIPTPPPIQTQSTAEIATTAPPSEPRSRVGSDVRSYPNPSVGAAYNPAPAAALWEEPAEPAVSQNPLESQPEGKSADQPSASAEPEPDLSAPSEAAEARYSSALNPKQVY